MGVNNLSNIGVVRNNIMKIASEYKTYRIKNIHFRPYNQQPSTFRFNEHYE